MKHFFTKDKINAFLIHLAISLGVFLVLLFFILVYWYPTPLFGTDGGWQGIRLIMAVDIVLGPLLTLIVFKKGKPSLVMDLTIIGFIQIGALMSGSWVVYNEHPALVVFTEDHFRPITAYQVKESGVAWADIEKIAQLYPPTVYLDLPDDLEALQNIRLKALQEGLLLSQFAEFYRPLTDDKKARIREKSVDMENYLSDKPRELKMYKDFLASHNNDSQNFLYFPLYSRYAISIVVVDRETIELLDVLDIEPPEYKVPAELRKRFKESLGS
jgi:hypothetical protein